MEATKIYAEKLFHEPMELLVYKLNPPRIYITPIDQDNDSFWVASEEDIVRYNIDVASGIDYIDQPHAIEVEYYPYFATDYGHHKSIKSLVSVIEDMGYSVVKMVLMPKHDLHTVSVTVKAIGPVLLNENDTAFGCTEIHRVICVDRHEGDDQSPYNEYADAINSMLGNISIVPIQHPEPWQRALSNKLSNKYSRFPVRWGAGIQTGVVTTSTIDDEGNRHSAQVLITIETRVVPQAFYTITEVISTVIS